jgi:hypothetical protein
MFRLQYVSNLYLHHYEKATFPLLVRPAARYLALSGNIGLPSNIYASFLNYASNYWDKVFYVGGETERFTNLNDYTKQYKNIFVLNDNNPSAYLQKANVAIVGATPTDCRLKEQIDRWTLQQAQICVITPEPPVPSFSTSNVRAWITSGHISAFTNITDKTVAVVNGRGTNETPSENYSTTAIVEFPLKEPDPNLDPLLVDSATGWS